MTGNPPVWKRAWYIDPNDNADIVPFNQLFGDNQVSFYAQLGMKGHNGIDYYAPDGAALFAPYDVKIVSVNDPIGDAAYQEGYGGYIRMAFKADGKYYEMVYGHIMDSFVKVGKEYGAGTLIGLSDNTGKYTTGAHLHWGVCETNASGERINQNNGYLGYFDQYPYLLDVEINKINDVEELYWYAAAKGDEPFGYYTGLLGGFRFNQAKKALGITSPVTVGNVYDFAIKHKDF